MQTDPQNAFAIQTEDLWIAFGGRKILAEVNLSVPFGSVFAILGPSGSGKSSFLSCLNRLSDLTPNCKVGGKVLIGGVDIHHHAIHLPTLRRRVGMIFQKPNPFPLSIRENLLLPMREHGLIQRGRTEDQVEGLLREVGLWDEVKDRLLKPALTLSGGQQQRLCIARALSLRPEILLLDEPCSALDPISMGHVEELLIRLRSKYTQVVVTHNLAQARRISDTVALFWVNDGCGKVVDVSPTAGFFESPQTPESADYVRGIRG